MYKCQNWRMLFDTMIECEAQRTYWLDSRRSLSRAHVQEFRIASQDWRLHCTQQTIQRVHAQPSRSPENERLGCGRLT